MQHLADCLQQDRGNDLWPHCGGSDVRREFAWKISQSRVFKVGHEDINCVESAAPSHASAAQVCPK